jgi:hypothetical protein
MAAPAWEQEWEALPELEFELEGAGFLEGEYELEGELEGEFETEQFFGRLAKMATSPALRRIGMAAARAALQSLGESELEGELEGEFEFENEGEGFLGGIVQGLGSLLGEGELEGEYELEYELNPIKRVYPDAMMEHLAHAAMEAENEQEAAEQFFPLIGLAAAKLLPIAAKAGAKLLPKLMKSAPKLIRGVSNMTRGLHRNRRTRPLLRTMPTIVNNTMNSLARQAASGRPITSQQAVRTLAQQANRVLSNPQRCARAYRRSRALDRQMHRVGGVPAGSRGTRCPACGR